MNAGQRVKYSTQWLKSIGCYTGELPFARGTIDSIQSVGQRLKLATIVWDGIQNDVPNKVNIVNLEKCN